MHVPSVVGAEHDAYAEDGNILPGVPKVQSSLFLPAGKTYDVTIQPKQTAAGTTTRPPTRSSTVRSACRPTTSATAACRRTSTWRRCCADDKSPRVPQTKPTDCVAGYDAGRDGSRQGRARQRRWRLRREPGHRVVGRQPQPLLISSPTEHLPIRNCPTDTTCGGTFAYLVNGTTLDDGHDHAVRRLWSRDGLHMGGAPVANDRRLSSNIASRLQISPPGVLGNDTDLPGFR